MLSVNISYFLKQFQRNKTQEKFWDFGKTSSWLANHYAMYIKKNDVKKLASLSFFYQIDWVIFFLQVQALFAHWFLLHGLVDCLSFYFCSCSVTESCPSLPVPWTVACQTSLSFTLSQSLLKSCPLSQWCYLTISSSAAGFSFCPQYFPASGSFPVSQLFTWGGQSIGASASASVLLRGFSGSSTGNKSACNTRDLGLIPGFGIPTGGGHGIPLQYSCLESPWRSLGGYSPWGHKELDTTEWLSTAEHISPSNEYSGLISFRIY